MIILLSPSKTISFEDAPAADCASVPVFLDDADFLMSKLKPLSARAIEKLMKVNPLLAAQTAEWCATWQAPFSEANAKPAAHCFKGAVYTGLDARAWSAEDRVFAQDRLIILSGLYGALRPFDLLQPYRLEMGLKWSPKRKTTSLYHYWGTRIQHHVARASEGLVINLASSEYSKAALGKDEGMRIISPEFKERVGDGFRAKMAYAKEARGAMARFLIQQRISNPEDLKEFNGMGYAFNPEQSDGDQWVFTRDTSTQTS